MAKSESTEAHGDGPTSATGRLLQAINILKVCAAHTYDDGEEFDLSYPLWAVVSLLEDYELNVEHASKIIEATTIVKAVAVTLTTTDTDIGVGGFEPSWALNAAIRLVDEVIHERAPQGKKHARHKTAMREISTVDPAHAREFHRPAQRRRQTSRGRARAPGPLR